MKIPEGWRYGRLDSFLVLQRGFDLTQREAEEGDVPVVSSSGISYYHNVAKVQPPGVVTGRKGKLGDVYFMDVPFWPHDTTLWVKDFRGNEPKFVRLFLQGFNLERFDAATSVPTLNRNNVHKLRVVFPPLEEQERIVEIIDAWAEAIALTERRIEAARQRKKGLMQRLLSGRVRFPEFAGEEWQRVTLGQVNRFIRNGFSSRQNKLGKGYPVTRIETISNGSVNLNAVGYTEARIEQLEKYRLRKGDILFSHINSLKHIAKAAIFDGAEELYHGMNLLAIRRERYTFGT